MPNLNLQFKINIPFAENGDKDDIPDTSPTGLVNNTDGLGYKYDTPIAEGGEYYERQIFNGVLYKIYAAVKELQDIAIAAGYPIDMTKALNVLNVENGGTGANNKQDAANNILKDVAVNSTLNNTDYVYTFADNAVKKITLTNLVNKIIPIGFIYIQYRNQSTPDILFGTDGKWQDVSAEYAGEFFRAVGGNSSSFGVTQAEGLPNITGGVSSGTGVYQNGLSAFQVSNEVQFSVPQQQGVAKANLDFDASICNPIYGASTHVTPYNSSIRIWKKIA